MTIDEFLKVELKVAKIITAERVTGSEKLIKLSLEAGDLDVEGKPISRQILAGIGKAYEPQDLIGKSIIIVANLEPRTMLGEISNGMLLAAHDSGGKAVLATIMNDVPPGSRLG